MTTGCQRRNGQSACNDKRPSYCHCPYRRNEAEGHVVQVAHLGCHVVRHHEAEASPASKCASGQRLPGGHGDRNDVVALLTVGKVEHVDLVVGDWRDGLHTHAGGKTDAETIATPLQSSRTELTLATGAHHPPSGKTSQDGEERRAEGHFSAASRLYGPIVSLGCKISSLPLINPDLLSLSVICHSVSTGHS